MWNNNSYDDNNGDINNNNNNNDNEAKNLLSPVWVNMCRLMDALRPNDLEHVVHLYGFSPVCDRLWSRNWSTRGKWRPQYSHSNGRSPKTEQHR